MMPTKEVLKEPEASQEVLMEPDTDKKVLLKFLEFEWLDHFQTRKQTWKTLEIEAVLVAGLIGIDWQLQNHVATGIASALLIMAAYFGARITLHHREVEVRKMSTIIDIEKKLGAEEMGLFKNVKVPSAMKWYEVFPRKPNKPSTLLFILIIHYIILAFGIIYLFFTVRYLI